VAVYLSNGVQVTVNSVDLSSLVSSVTLNRTFDELEVTAMGDSGHKFVKGLEASSVTIDFFNDSATSKTLQTLQAAYGTNVTVTLKQTSAATSATNPLYTMTCLVNNLTDINGAVGDLSTQSVTWNVSGTVAVTTS
jgi:predicted oxidoreductase (fatty acid repression mutant protein)